MKSTGIVRPIDELGRVVIPKELRRTMNINNGDTMEIFTSEDKIILRKYSPGCAFCDNVSDLMQFNGKSVCGSCRKKLMAVLDRE